MKKTKKTILTAALLSAAAAMTLTGCTKDDVQTVYGPPPDEDTSVTSENKESSDAPESVPADEPSEYDPSSEEVQDVYGPPPEDDESSIAPDDEESSYAPEADLIQVEYGPYLDTDENSVSDDSNSFDASLELQQLVYGPPEAFE